MMWELVCESQQCNPLLPHFDGLRARLAVARVNNTKEAGMLLERVQYYATRLKHTLHVPGPGESEAICTVCNHSRRW